MPVFLAAARSSRLLVRLSVALPLLTIVTCYSIAIALHHVTRPFLPMISDCGVMPPEKYIFRIGFISSAPLLIFTAFLVRDYIATRARCLDSRGDKGLTVRVFGVACEDISVVAMVVASGCLALLAAVSEEESSDLHTVAALGFFLVYIVYSTPAPLLTHPTNKFMFRLRASAAALVSISIAIFFYVAQSGAFRKTLFLSPFFVQAHANVIAGLPYNPYASMPEWFGTIIILCFNLSFVRDFDGDAASSGSFKLGLGDMRIATVFQDNGGRTVRLLGADDDVLSDGGLGIALIC